MPPAENEPLAIGAIFRRVDARSRCLKKGETGLAQFVADAGVSPA